MTDRTSPVNDAKHDCRQQSSISQGPCDAERNAQKTSRAQLREQCDGSHHEERNQREVSLPPPLDIFLPESIFLFFRVFQQQP